ncbi:efflux RND transporter permease subunit [Desulfobotulus sp.]|uniref:efflux RND transporter permease subunit n=1 Tax=Desulfobotulus sp. TaxID=1940337 RepID=UPI002A35F765|nr:MMPL family transporter [Desulfobotulus sp.]MDY0163052.1 MMPL family transporter [Desulfobotulus sp.]
MPDSRRAAILLSFARRPRLLFPLLFFATLFLAFGAKQLSIQNDIMFMLPDSNAEKLFFLETQEKFGSGSGIAIAISSEKGIYDPLLLEKIKKAGDRIRNANQTIPARILQKNFSLGPSEALLITALLQNHMRMEGPDVLPETSLFTESEVLEEALSEALPPALYGEDQETLIQATVEHLSRMVAALPHPGAALMGVISQPTDSRGFNRGVWVDTVSSLMESDTVWPEFAFPEDLEEFFLSRGFSEKNEARTLSRILLERGKLSPQALHELLHKEEESLMRSGLSKIFLSRLQEKSLRDADLLSELSGLLQQSPKQIRTGRIFTEGESSLEDLKTRLHAWSLFEGGLYSKEERSALILIRTAPNLTKAHKALLLSEVRQILDEVFGDSPYHPALAGEPVVDDAIGESMENDIQRLFPFVTLVVMACLFLMFRNLSGVLYPMLTVLLSLVWCFGIMGYAGVPVSLVSSALPVLLVAVGTAYAIHLTHALQEKTPPAADRNERIKIAGRVLSLTGGGVLMAGLTTFAGFISLASNSIVPLRDFGIFIGLGVIFALGIAMVLTPALFIRFGFREKSLPPITPAEKSPFITRICLFCCKKPKTVTALYLGLFCLSMAGFSLLRVEMNNITFFREEAPIRKDDTFINKHFAGTTGLSVVFSGKNPGDALDPDLLRFQEALGRHLTASHPEIGKIVSVADFIRKMNQAFFDNDPARYRLPTLEELSGEQSETALKAQYEAYMDKYQRKDTKSFLDPEKKEGLLSIQLRTGASSKVEEVARTVRAFLNGPEGQILKDKGIGARLTGAGLLYIEANQLIVKGQIGSILISLVLVFLVVSRIMKSFIYGLFSLIPLTFTIMGIFGFMGFTAIPLDVATAITACVAIGIGIDYGIHYLVHYRDARNRGRSHTEAIKETAAGTGKAIFFNAAAVTAGFLVLLASAFIPLVHLGLLISLTMVCSALAAVTLLPAVLTLTAAKLHPAHTITGEAGKLSVSSSSQDPLTLDSGGHSHAA